MNDQKFMLKRQNRLLILPALVSLVLVMPVSVFSQTHVGGSVSGEWLEDYSPYWVDNSLVIEASSELIIHPGVEVIFFDEDSILVQGTLTANGEPNMPIVFRLDDDCEKQWKGISFVGSSSSESELDYCKITGPLFGIMCTMASPTIENCRIEATHKGIYAYMSYPVIQNDTVIVEFSDASLGVIIGIQLNQSPVKIENCIVTVNNSTPLGSVTAFGVHAIESNVSLVRNRIEVWAKCKPVGVYLSHSSKDSIIYNEIIAASENAYVQGGLIHNESVTGFISNNTIVVNGPNKDYALKFQNSSYLSQVYNNIIKGDSSSWGIHCSDSYPDTIQYNDLYAHSSMTNYPSCPALDFTNIYDNPEFAYIAPNNLYFLTPHSPCIDAGNPAPFFLDPDETIGDIGAHYYPQPVVGIKPVPDAVTTFDLVNLYPNPTNGAANISFSLLTAGKVKITSYNLLGRQVKVIHAGELDSGDYLLNWDMSGLSSGVYNVFISTPDYRYSRQVSLIR